ncbi:MAG: maleylpyruvate isomerase N-terminal domain-containing protein [Gemmatimonadaceae bacterium]|nr:maleylpyruvate isomerase N-terminal domain-containing protein [Gemmatimonadaceae bacterium]
MAKPRRAPRPRPKSRAELTAREAEAWAELTAAWRGLPDVALQQPGACGPDWSVKDVMNHIAAWLEAAMRVIPELRRGRPATAGHSVDRFNALRHAEDQDRSLAATRRRLNVARRQVLALCDALPEKQILDYEGRIGWWIKYSTYGHYSEHLYELTEFRARMTTGR